MLKALIIDDESTAQDVMIYLINKHCPNVKVVGTANGVATAFDQIHKEKPDVIFLDINMKDGNGFQLLDQFDGFNFHVVFMTAYDEYALKAFKYNALDYLVKPVDGNALIKTISKIEDLQEHHIKNYTEFSPDLFESIVIYHNYEYHKIPIADIIMCESNNNYTGFIISGTDKPMLSSKTLKHYEELLPESQFIRVHQKYLVSISRISKFDSRNSILYLDDRSTVPVSVRKKSIVLKSLRSKK